MKRRSFRRCGTPPGTVLSPADQAAVDAFRALLLVLRDPKPWTPESAEDVAIRVGPFIERAHPRPGDVYGDLIAVALVHPDTPHAAAYLHGHQLGYTKTGWLRCETTAILGAWQAPYAPFTHAAAGRNLPDNVGMPPAHYAVHIEAHSPDGTSHTLLRLGPYNQTWLASRDADRINTELKGRAAAVVPGCTVTAKDVPFDDGDRARYSGPYGADLVALLAAAVKEGTAA